ncbi:leiomodin-1 isoform X2 [Scleropages formosus]|uniref:leiomodin-1 isoform X2 n=1 Tax=Scleropages formosus TaxID=113540 RepID=UPI000878238F|nr:leiomodin-1 isoform X2 [Scleropages formosus]
MHLRRISRNVQASRAALTKDQCICSRLFKVSPPRPGARSLSQWVFGHWDNTPVYRTVKQQRKLKGIFPTSLCFQSSGFEARFLGSHVQVESTSADTDRASDLNMPSLLRKRSPLEKQSSIHNNVDAKVEPKKLSERQLSVEAEPKKESLKQQYLKKMGLSQEKSLSRSESQEREIQRQNSMSGERDYVRKGKSNMEEKPGPSNQFLRDDSQETERKGGSKEKEMNEESKPRERKDDGGKKEEGSSKTKELISKLQEKKEEARDKERKDENRKREDSKTKELISKLWEKSEKEEIKEREKKEEIRKKEDYKTRGLISRLEEKQSQAKENKTDDRKNRGEEKSKEDARLAQTGSQQEEKDDKKMEKQKEKENDRGIQGEKEKEQRSIKARAKEKEKDNVKRKETEKGKAISEGLKHSMGEEPVGEKGPESKAKEKAEDEDDDASMFDELLEKVSNNDPQLTELNVNNSEVIKNKTLIQFAEALRDNMHVKTFALANTRADDHVAYAIAGTLRVNKTITSINLDSNHLTSKGIIALIQALQHNATLTELRFHNQRHICGGKTEMEMAKVLKENTTLLKLGYHFELAGPRMTMTNILSRNMDRQRQRRLQEQKQAQADGEKKETLEIPKTSGGFLKTSPKPSPKVSPLPSPQPSPKVTPKKGGGETGPPPPPPPPPPAPALDINCLRSTLTPVSQRKLGNKGSGFSGNKNSRDQLLASIRNSNIKQLKKVELPKLLQ